MIDFFLSPLFFVQHKHVLYLHYTAIILGNDAIVYILTTPTIDILECCNTVTTSV